jgi:hypothetical protein
MLTYFNMIWDYDKFSKQNTKSSKICAFSKNKFSKFDYKHIGPTINIIYKKFQNISIENSSLGKHVFWGKKPHKGQYS